MVKFRPPRPYPPTLATVPESTPHVLASHRHHATKTQSPPPIPCSLLCPSSAYPSPPLHRPVSPLPNAELLAILDGTTPSLPTGNATLPDLRDRGIVNTGGMCFSNAVLQLLVHSPPLWNLLRQLGDLKELCGEGGTVTGGAQHHWWTLR
ncbi:hypothetical protein BJV77DRAFT_770682 [Russula vinacea]|nr:hypothetical protein BJV77DRAFT_770682 [Russula vinacea]